MFRPRRRALLAPVILFAATGCGISPEYMDEPEYPASEPAHQEVSASLPADPDLVGRYEGVGRQSNGPTWSVAVTLTDPSVGACAIVRFPDDGCTGYWQCTRVDGDRIEAVERITRGKDKCLDGVQIEATLLRDGHTLAFVAEAKGVKAVGKLRRVD
ncbi:MAG TPA: hypothetical protein ENK57_23535 [Polyangiaceae bacterium]|nr:hypothetical protein [Polyangiaceae bacterium]